MVVQTGGRPLNVEDGPCPHTAEDSPAFALPSGVLLGLVNAWQYFEGGLRFPFLATLQPIRPFYGVYAYPHPVTHFELLIEWLKNKSSTSSIPRSEGGTRIDDSFGLQDLLTSRVVCRANVLSSRIFPRYHT